MITNKKHIFTRFLYGHLFGLMLCLCTSCSFGRSSIDESQLSDLYLIGISYSESYGDYWDLLTYDIIITKQQTALLTVNGNIIDTVPIDTPVYNQMVSLFDYEEFMSLRASPGSHSSDGATYYMKLYDKQQQVIYSVGSSMPQQKNFNALYKSYKELLAQTDIESCREEHINRWTQITVDNMYYVESNHIQLNSIQVQELCTYGCGSFTQVTELGYNEETNSFNYEIKDEYQQTIHVAFEGNTIIQYTVE